MAAQPCPDRARVKIDALKAAELEEILGPGDHAGADVWGLALSGGGIRSATYALGVLQSLARLGLLRCFHYVSTVSGGGYIGAFLQGLLVRRGFDETNACLGSKLLERASVQESNPDADATQAEFRQRPIQHLREYSNYISPRKSPMSGDTLGMVGTYVRNLLLIQTQLWALMLGLAMVPLLLYRLMQVGLGKSPFFALILAGALSLVAAVCLAYVTSKSASSPSTGAPGYLDEPVDAVRYAAIATIWLLALASLFGAISLANFTQLPSKLKPALDRISPGMEDVDRLAWIAALLYAGAWLLWSLREAIHWWDSEKRGEPPVLYKNRLQFLFATVLSAIFLRYAVQFLTWVLALPRAVEWGDAHWKMLTLGPPMVFIALGLTGVLHLGLAGSAISDLQREVWARVGGKAAAFVVFGMVLPLAITVYSPWLVWRMTDDDSALWDGIGWAGLLTWLSTTGVGLVVAHGKRASSRSRVMEIIVRVAPWVFMLGVLMAVSFIGHKVLEQLSGIDHPPASPGSLDAHLAWVADIGRLHVDAVLKTFAFAIATWWLLGTLLDVNEFSLNAFYRNRLVRCFLGSSNDARKPEATTNFDTNDDLPLSDVLNEKRDRRYRPLYPLVNTALNLVATKQLDWQDRKAASFLLSPLYCGYVPAASRFGAPNIGDPAIRDPSSLAKSISLGSATAISGAAVNPNMGYHSSSAVTFLLTLFDARLGWWVPNCSHPKPPKLSVAPFFGRWLLAEMLGRTHDGGKYVHLSDGGHFENLGLYELVRRRCRFILCVDATADPRRAFSDLGNAVQKCRVDLGARIDIDVTALKPGPDGIAARTCAVGEITYGEGADAVKGVLLYVKPTLTGQEENDILHYASSHARFPHEPTSDQYFGESQFESYRRLGEFAAEAAVATAMKRVKCDPGTDRHKFLGVHDSTVKDALLAELRHHWVAPLPSVAAHFAAHSKSLSALFSKLRRSEKLRVLDAQIYPAWTDLVKSCDAAPGSDARAPEGRRIRMPADKDFRACFYFCQELIQLMEGVYHDLELEKWATHPDNRGWMNLFRHWSWSPMFRIAWAIGAPTYGARFTRFCELMLDLPRRDSDDPKRRTLFVKTIQIEPGLPWADSCNALHEDGRINHVERDILLSDPVVKNDEPAIQLHTLQIKWKSVLPRTSVDIPDTTLGIAALSRSGHLRVFRVQDHLRGLGLGREFMRLLASKAKIDRADIRKGYYGAVGVLRGRDADRTTRYLQSLLERTLKMQKVLSQSRNATRGARAPVDPPKSREAQRHDASEYGRE